MPWNPQKRTFESGYYRPGRMLLSLKAVVATTAAFRANGGYTDSDNSSTDLSVGAPAPRNYLSALNPCGVTLAPEPRASRSRARVSRFHATTQSVSNALNRHRTPLRRGSCLWILYDGPAHSSPLMRVPARRPLRDRLGRAGRLLCRFTAGRTWTTRAFPSPLRTMADSSRIRR